MSPSTLQDYALSTCYAPGTGTGACTINSDMSANALAAVGALRKTDGSTHMCERVIHTESRCGQLAGWGTGAAQSSKCEAMRGNLYHNPATGRLHTCEYDPTKGCRAASIQVDEGTAAVLHECARRSTSSGSMES
jgi:hypothetical protein